MQQQSDVAPKSDIFSEVSAIAGVQVAPPSPRRVVWKYSVSDDLSDGETTLEVPVGAEYLSVVLQHQGPVVYFLVDPDESLVQRTFRWVKTGIEIPETYVYLDPLALIGLTSAGPKTIVAHLFEVYPSVSPSQDSPEDSVGG